MDSQKLRELSKKKVPVAAYIALAFVFMIFAGIIFAGNFTGSNVSEPADEKITVANYPLLSLRAHDKLRIGMTRTQVVSLLGEPQWASIPGDKGGLALISNDFGLELRWANPDCRDITVIFGKNPQTVIGWDDGGNYCGDKETTDHAPYSCEKPDRQFFCTR